MRLLCRAHEGGVAANIKAMAPVAEYLHCAMRVLSLSRSQAVFSITDIRHAEDVITYEI